MAETIPANTEEPNGRSPWWWVPSAYIAEGLPYVIVNTVSIVMYTRLGVTPAQMAFFTSLLLFPWVIKPLWGPLVDLYWTKRKWIILMQLLMAGALAAVAFSLQTSWWWTGTLLALSVAALLSATQDIAIDGFYMIALNEHKQALFVGIRSTFYRVAMIFGQGILIMLVGVLESKTGPEAALLKINLHPGGSAPAAAAAEAPAPGFLRFDPPVLTMESGTTAPLAVTLAEEPQTTVVVSVSSKPMRPLHYFFKIGPEQLVSIKKGERLEFGPGNWNQAVELVAESDAKNQKSLTAFWQATAGNVSLTWTYFFSGLGGLFILFCGLHAAVLPKPQADGPTVGMDRPPFVVALSAIVPLVAVPLFLFLAFFYGMSGAFSSIARFVGLPAIALFANVNLHTIFGVIASVALLTALALGARKLAAKAGDGVGGSAAGIGAFLIAVMSLAILMHIGIRPLMYFTGSLWKLSLKPELYSFAATAVLLLIVWVIYLSSRVRNVSLGALRGSAKVSRMSFDEVFISFFRKPGIGRMILFLLVYRLGEAMLVKMAAPFLITPREAGGLGLSIADYGLAYGTVGILAMTIGGILGGVVASYGGLKRWILPMCFAINIPDALYIYLAAYRPESFSVVLTCVATEALGYGFGFVAYMLYMIYIAGQGEHKTTHFALCTAFMALGMMLPGMVSGAIQQITGWVNFFIIVCIATLPGFLMLGIIPLDPEFGKKHDKAA